MPGDDCFLLGSASIHYTARLGRGGGRVAADTEGNFIYTQSLRSHADFCGASILLKLL